MSSTGIPDIKSRFIQPPTEKTGAYLPLLPGQTVCTVKNEKGENCLGHIKQWFTASKEDLAKAAAGNVLHRCQRCQAVYEGPPKQHLNPLPKKKK
ncbi:MAG: hypothetical protein AB1757_18130 [Acidobacteriota bacterium]